MLRYIPTELRELILHQQQTLAVLCRWQAEGSFAIDQKDIERMMILICLEGEESGRGIRENELGSRM